MPTKPKKPCKHRGCPLCIHCKEQGKLPDKIIMHAGPKKAAKYGRSKK